MREKRTIPFQAHDKSKLQYIRRVETILVEDGTFVYTGAPIQRTEELVKMFRRLADQAREQAVVLLMDNVGLPIGYDMWLGGNDFVAIDPRRIILIAGELVASKIAVCHNHSHGNAKPSEADTMFCLQLCQLSKIMGWEVFDFVVIGPHSHFSFRQEKHPALTSIRESYVMIKGGK